MLFLRPVNQPNLWPYVFRSWFAKNDLFFCEPRFFRMKDDFGSLFWDREDARLFSEIVPHCIQCILLLAMAAERYILVCHPIHAVVLLNRRRRITFYTTITILIICLVVLFLNAYRTGFTYTDKKRSERTALHQILNVGKH